MVRTTMDCGWRRVRLMGACIPDRVCGIKRLFRERLIRRFGVVNG
jgi:hypothetical protein